MIIHSRSRIEFNNWDGQRLQLNPGMSEEAIARYNSVVQSLEDHSIRLGGDPFSEGKNEMYDAYPVQRDMPMDEVHQYLCLLSTPYIVV